MFGEGGFIGPDLTGYQRDDLRGLVRHVVDPSAQIRVGFETQLVVTNDGRTVSGFLVDADEKAVTLRGIDGQNVTIRRDEIDELIVQRQLLMPERLLEEYTTQQVRDLFAYLRISQPLTREAVTRRARESSPNAPGGKSCRTAGNHLDLTMT